MLALFPTCLGEALNRAAVRDSQRLLAAAGVASERPAGATCCGQPAWNSGFVRDARRVARRTLRALADAEVVVVPAGSCAAMMRLHWPHLFKGERDQDLAERVSARTFELSQYLVDQLEWSPPEPDTRTRVSYHDSCHMLRELRLHDQPRALLAAVADLHELPRADRCCGFGGTFSVRYPDVSTAMADDKLASAATIAATTVASADPGCVMQIEGRAARTGAGLRVVHLATIVAEAL
ncbi:MAG TPA: (Fe-S)-binding protein [Gaiellales bacterium]